MAQATSASELVALVRARRKALSAHACAAARATRWRSIGRAGNAALLLAFGGRCIWLFDSRMVPFARTIAHAERNHGSHLRPHRKSCRRPDDLRRRVALCGVGYHCGAASGDFGTGLSAAGASRWRSLASRSRARPGDGQRRSRGGAEAAALRRAGQTGRRRRCKRTRPGRTRQGSRRRTLSVHAARIVRADAGPAGNRPRLRLVVQTCRRRAVDYSRPDGAAPPGIRYRRCRPVQLGTAVQRRRGACVVPGVFRPQACPRTWPCRGTAADGGGRRAAPPLGPRRCRADAAGAVPVHQRQCGLGPGEQVAPRR